MNAVSGFHFHRAARQNWVLQTLGTDPAAFSAAFETDGV
jgi:hypothetical protein